MTLTRRAAISNHRPSSWLYLAFLMTLHFAVDFLCIYTVYTNYPLEAPATAYAVILYNCLAFLTQPAFGLVLEDRLGKTTLAVSALLVLLGTTHVQLWLTVVMLGLGNSLFHVSGGKMTMKMSGGGTELGLFVGPGALGLGLGAAAAGTSWLLAVVIAITLILPLALFLLPESKKREPRPIKTGVRLVIVLVLSAVLIRSFLGSYVRYSFTVPNFMLLVALCSCLGKMVGGLVTDLGGETATIVLSSVIAAAVMPFVSAPACAFIGIFLFNLAMPLTLLMANRLLPKNQGFAFGLLAMILIPGYYLGVYLKPQYTPLVLVPVLLINALMLFTANLQMGKKQ